MKSLSRISCLLLMLSLLAVGSAPQQSVADNSRAFPETGKTINGPFLDYWTKLGGLMQQGYPISEQFQEKSDIDGKTYPVQYFERAELEGHPENQPPFRVLLTLLGNLAYKQNYPNGAPGQVPNTSPASVLFEQTGKRLGGKFLSYWRSYGGLMQQGYPISDEFAEKSPLNGQTYSVQYFERAEFELHPENQPPFDVLLSQLGTLHYRQKYPNGAPGGRSATLPAPPLSAPGSVKRDVTYCSSGGVDQKMDIYFPQGTGTGPAPVAVYVHGGGWEAGDKGGGAGGLDIPTLVDRGYVVASINYRLAPRYKFPAQIEDTKCAIRYLRANARAYNLDPSRIGAWGSSAGGHLVSLLGVTDGSTGFEGNGGYADQSSRVQAVVDQFGPADLTAGDFIALHTQLFKDVFGDAAALVRASPVTYITPDDPPFLILQGEKDTTVPPNQSQEFYDKLWAAGVPATLVMVKNAGHGFSPVGGPISPTRAELTKMLADFFDANLRK